VRDAFDAEDGARADQRGIDGSRDGRGEVARAVGAGFVQTARRW
jgi:hypothetical protein